MKNFDRYNHDKRIIVNTTRFFSEDQNKIDSFIGSFLSVVIIGIVLSCIFIVIFLNIKYEIKKQNLELKSISAQIEIFNDNFLMAIEGSGFMPAKEGEVGK